MKSDSSPMHVMQHDLAPFYEIRPLKSFAVTCDRLPVPIFGCICQPRGPISYSFSLSLFLLVVLQNRISCFFCCIFLFVFFITGFATKIAVTDMFSFKWFAGVEHRRRHLHSNRCGKGVMELCCREVISSSTTIKSGS